MKSTAKGQIFLSHSHALRGNAEGTLCVPWVNGAKVKQDAEASALALPRRSVVTRGKHGKKQSVSASALGYIFFTGVVSLFTRNGRLHEDNPI